MQYCTSTHCSLTLGLVLFSCLCQTPLGVHEHRDNMSGCSKEPQRIAFGDCQMSPEKPWSICVRSFHLPVCPTSSLSPRHQWGQNIRPTQAHRAGKILLLASLTPGYITDVTDWIFISYCANWIWHLIFNADFPKINGNNEVQHICRSSFHEFQSNTKLSTEVEEMNGK